MNTKKLFIFSPWFMGVLFVIYAIAMAFATFYENDFGATAAKTVVYNTKWFELIMMLMVVNLMGQIFLFKLYKKRKLSVLLFHLAFVLIIIGAAITRYTGFEGNIRIREGATQNICASLDKYLSVSVRGVNGNEVFSDSKKMVINNFTKIRYNKEIAVGDHSYRLKYKGFMPNAAETIVEDVNGSPIVSFMFSKNMMGRENIVLKQDEVKSFIGFKIAFNDSEADVNIIRQNNSILITSAHPVNVSSMMAEEAVDFEPGEFIVFEKMKIYKIKDFIIVADKVIANGRIDIVGLKDQHNTGKSVMQFDLESDQGTEKLNLWVSDMSMKGLNHQIGDYNLNISYGSIPVELPFSLKLEDFILDRYPGSNSPSSYKSNVVLLDPQNNVEMPYSIYMNHILKYKGWRFYQSSYDQDERGTILSVNKDSAGMFVTYLGYFALILFIVVSVLNKHSALRIVNKSFFTKSVGVILLFLISTVGFAQMPNHTQANIPAKKFVIDKDYADLFGEILVQNQSGRTEPLFTLSNDILRKVSRETEMLGYSPMQIFLGFYFDFNNWQHEPIIKISNNELKKLINVNADYAAFSDIVDLTTGTYKIKRHLDEAYNKPANKRTKFDKELIKVNERINICYMISIGEFMKIFPVGDKGQKWFAPNEAYKLVKNSEDSLYLRNIVGLYAQGVERAYQTGDYTQADEVFRSIKNYQNNFAQYELPSERKIGAEIFYYKAQIYERLFPFYSALGLILLLILIYGVIAQGKNLKNIINVFLGLLVVGFVFHTIGLAVRWYVSGHAPMSNGYESMIFISWVTILAGFIFIKRSAFVLAATSILGGFTLMVAHLSFMDPQITNLVPVLQSYWLTLHVSVITGSYGFLGLGAIIGLITMVLYVLSNKKNKENIIRTVEELSIINYKSLTIGLYLLTIGTFLGAIWANESWGRYWGWDPKETWSLITMIVYSFVLHARLIDGLKSYFAFNTMAIYGFSSVLMTYFGVNYYLSGLHSYAGGDPVPVPSFVYIAAVVLVSLSVLAYFKYRKEIK